MALDDILSATISDDVGSSNSPANANEMQDDEGYRGPFADGTRPKSLPEAADRNDGLDKAISAAFEQHEAAEREYQEYEAAEPEVRYFRERFGDEGGAFSKIAEGLIGWNRAFKENPRFATERLQVEGLRNFNFGHAAASASKPIATDKSSTSDALGSAIDKALNAAENKQRTQASFASDADARKALREEFPGLTTKQIMQRAKAFHEEIQRDPLSGALRIGASYGLPLTPLGQK